MNVKQLRRATARIPRNIERKNATETPEQKLENEIKSIKDQIIAAVKGKADVETVKEMQRQLDGLDVKLAERHAAATPEESLEHFLREDDGLQKFMRDKAGSFTLQLNAKQTQRLFERKTTITSDAVGVSTSGVLSIERAPGIVGEARRRLMVRDALTSRPTTMQLIDFVRVNTPPAIASPQTKEARRRRTPPRSR
jgi:hypothetical protein